MERVISLQTSLAAEFYKGETVSPQWRLPGKRHCPLEFKRRGCEYAQTPMNVNEDTNYKVICGDEGFF
jgi:hypothetical protein